MCKRLQRLPCSRDIFFVIFAVVAAAKLRFVGWKTSTSAAHRSLNLITSIGRAIYFFHLIFVQHSRHWSINSLRTISFTLDGCCVYDFLPNPLPFRWDYACHTVHSTLAFCLVHTLAHHLICAFVGRITNTENPTYIWLPANL